MRDMLKDITSEVVYGGEALVDGSMDVRELAPALLALGDVLQSANREINGDRAELSVFVESDFKGGSFHLKLGLLLTAAQHLSSFFGPDTIASAKQIAQFVGLVSGIDVSLFGLLKLLKGRQPTSVTTLADGSIQIHVTGDNNTVNVSLPPVRPEVYKLAQPPQIREAVSRAMAPLRRPGIDTMETRDAGKVVEHVEKGDLPSFEPPPAVEARPIPLDANPPRQAILEVIKPSFKEGLKWRVSDGGNEFGVSMSDKNFLARVERGERAFSKGDKLRVEMKSTPFMAGDKLSTEHEILNVLGEFDAPRQMSVFPDPEPGGGG